jgi:hypothetical protein
MGVQRRDTLDRIIEKVVLCPKTGCEEWTGFINRKGYGELRAYGKTVRAHRERYRLEVGDPGDQILRHTCDNPRCCRLDHLIPGTIADNNRDMKERGRNKYPVFSGEENAAAKLTEDLVRAIRSDNRSTVALAKAYGVSQSLMSMVKRRQVWKHI